MPDVHYNCYSTETALPLSLEHAIVIQTNELCNMFIQGKFQGVFFVQFIKQLGGTISSGSIFEFYNETFYILLQQEMKIPLILYTFYLQIKLDNT